MTFFALADRSITLVEEVRMTKPVLRILVTLSLAGLAACGSTAGENDAADARASEAVELTEPIAEAADTADTVDTVDTVEPLDAVDVPPDPASCPVAVISVEEGEEVIPRTALHLHGDASHAVSGAIARYEWSVLQPTGSAGLFTPTSAFPNPIFEANVAGTYRFSLTVWDDAGRVSCQPALAEVVVTCDCGVHVELLWDTPGDPNPDDTGPAAGTDLDLHFAHPDAAVCDVDGDGQADPWFDLPWDTYWFNTNPDWGSFDPSADDDPRLDRDDNDGWGPENVNLDRPEPEAVYRVGVHYRDDYGFGPSLATVRVYIYSALMFEVPGVELQPGDLWDVAKIEWPSAKVTLVLNQQGEYAITPHYPDSPTCP